MGLFALASAIFDAVCNGFMIVVGIGVVGACVTASMASLRKETPKPEEEKGVFVEGHYV